MEFRSLVFQYVAQVLNWLLVALTATVVIAIRKGPHKAGQSTGFYVPATGYRGTTPNNRSITNDQPRQITDRLALYLNLGEYLPKCCSLSLQGKNRNLGKPSFTYFEAKSDDHAETKRDFLCMEAGHSKADYFAPVRIDFPVVDELLAEGEFSETFWLYLGAGKRRQQNLCAARHARSVRGIPKTVSLDDKTCRWCRRSRKQQDH